MPVFIELITDAFEEIAQEQSVQAKLDRGNRRVRRPTRGLEIKEDTPAIIKVVQADGTEVPLLDSGSPSGTSTQYSNFLLQSVQETRMEKHQVVDTFGEAYIYLFGEHPRFIDVQAILINSNDFNWEAEFWANYEQYFRGTKSVESGARTYLFYDDTIVDGYILQAQAAKTSDSPLMLQLNFRMFLTGYRNISFVGSPDYPIRGGVNLGEGVDLTTSDGFTVANASLNAAIQQAAADDAAARAALGDASPAPDAASLTDVLRGGPVDAGTLSAIERAAQGTAVAGNFASGNVRKLPLRSRIADNFDEFLGARVPLETAAGGPSSATPLPIKLADLIKARGARIDNPQSFRDSGLSPSFSPTDGQATFGPPPGGTDVEIINTGDGSSVGAGASFEAGVGLTAGLGGGFGIGGGVSGGAGASFNPLTGAAAGTVLSGGVTGSTGVGASIAVGGEASLFSLISVAGTLGVGGTVSLDGASQVDQDALLRGDTSLLFVG